MVVEGGVQVGAVAVGSVGAADVAEASAVAVGAGDSKRRIGSALLLKEDYCGKYLGVPNNLIFAQIMMI